MNETWFIQFQDHIYSKFSPEYRLLLACLQQSLCQSVLLASSHRQNECIDWERFFTLASWHRVVPVVYPILRNDEDIPKDLTTSLQQQFVKNARRGLVRAAESVSLLNAFTEQQIPVILLKGVALSLQLYGDIACRHHGDIDLLIPSGMLEQSEQFLRQIGYQRHYPIPELVMTPTQRRQFIRLRHNMMYYHPDRHIRLELHWKLHYIYPLFPLNFEQLYKERQTVQIAHCPIPVLSPKHALLFLFVHGASHAWYRLYWLYDVAWVVCYDQTTDWEYLMAEARELRMARSVMQGCLLAHLLLQSPLPEPVWRYAHHDPSMPVLLKEAVHTLREHRRYNRAVTAFIHHKRYLMRLRPGQRHKFEILQAALLAPNDWQRYKLPDALFPLYYLLRPVFWLFQTHQKPRRNRQDVCREA